MRVILGLSREGRQTPARYAAIVPWPTTSSPAYRHASWPGAVRSAGSLSSHAHALVASRAQPRRPAGTRSRRPRARTRTPSTQPPSRCSVTSRTRTLVAQQLLARADRDGVRARVGREHVQRLAAADAEPVALADGEQVRAGVLAEHAPARDRRSRPGRSPSPPWRSRKAPWRVPARKHRSCESRRRATASPAAARQLAHLRLGHRPQREAQARQRLGRERRQHVALVLAARRARAAAAAGLRLAASLEHARVVAGRERLARRAARPARASRRGARCRCSARTGSASGRRRGRPASGRRRRRGTPRAGRSRGAASRARARARARRAPPAPSSSSARRRSPGRTTARA